MSALQRHVGARRSAERVSVIAMMGIALLLSGCAETSTPVPSGSASKERAPDSAADDSPSRVFYGTRHEYTLAVAECMTAAGWDARVSPMDEDGGTSIEYDLPVEQRDQLDAALQACLEQLGRLDQGYSNPARLRAWYEFELERSERLEAAGWDVEPPPSFETLADQFASQGYLGWDAGFGVTPGEEAKAQRACPDSTDF